MEYYPFYRGGRLQGFVRTFSDYLEVRVPEGSRTYLWEGQLGYLHPGESPFYKAFYEPPTSIPDAPPEQLEERLRRLAEAVGGKLRGRRVMVDFSGGKDSTLNLLLLSLLSEQIGFSVTPVYVHVPYLEPPENIDHAESIAGRLGYSLEIVEASRPQMLFYLAREGLPKRGVRWCTYLKMRALREARKRLRPDYEAKAERVAESGKRAEKLSRTFARAAYVSGSSLNLVYDMPINEVAAILRSWGLVHPHYLDGLPRVSCSLCPYRGLYELELSARYPLEDEGLVEQAALLHYRRYYSARVSWEDYWRYGLWRFAPSMGLLRLRERERADPSRRLSLSEAREMFSSMWVAGGGGAPHE